MNPLYTGTKGKNETKTDQKYSTITVEVLFLTLHGKGEDKTSSIIYVNNNKVETNHLTWKFGKPVPLKEKS